MTNLSQLRICHQLVPKHQDDHRTINRLGAAFYGAKLWPQNKQILIGFYGNPSSPNTPEKDRINITEYIEDRPHYNTMTLMEWKRVLDRLDPIQKQINKKLKLIKKTHNLPREVQLSSNPSTIDIVPMVKKIVMERLQPLVKSKI